MFIQDLHIDRDRLAELCRRYEVARLEVFGSFARGDAGPASDLDVLVTYLPGREPGIKFITFCLDLQALVGRKVDLLTRDTVEESDNPWFRSLALSHVEEIYSAPAA